MGKSIAIFGAGGLGREVQMLLKALPQWNVIGFFDDNKEKGTLINDVEVMGDRQILKAWPEKLNIVFAMGNPNSKKALSEFLKNSGQLTFPALIHPKAILMDAERIQIGEGAILAAGCILTTNVKIEKHVLINLNATIGHDCHIGESCSIMPGVNLAGGVRLGEAVLVGSGASILNQISVGDSATIGAGAVVTRNVDKYTTAVGVPARDIKATS
jgi:sugar O-acyltransferase (sialic acid O-acetyltransferase NeuD family)